MLYHMYITDTFVNPTDPLAAPASEFNRECSQQHFFNNVIRQIPDKWRSFGYCLDIRIGDLNAIDTTRGPQHCFMEVYSLWKSGAQFPLTWDTVINVLEGMGETELATKLRKELSRSRP